MGFHPAHLHQDTLDLRREDVDSPDDEHIVGSARYPVHPHMGASADAGLEAERGHVTGTIADDGESFLGDGSEHQFSHFAMGQDFTRLRVHHFRDEMVLEDMEAVAPLETLDGDSRADHLAQPINVEGLEVELALDFVAHVL